jgi:hypothetical protein
VREGGAHGYQYAVSRCRSLGSETSGDSSPTRSGLPLPLVSATQAFAYRTGFSRSEFPGSAACSPFRGSISDGIAKSWLGPLEPGELEMVPRIRTRSIQACRTAGLSCPVVVLPC